MFVKFYQYRIKSKNLKKWKDINDKTKALFEKKYNVDSQRLIKKEDKFINIIEMDHYKSKEDYLKIKDEMDKDRQVNSLFLEFIEIVFRRKLLEDEYETI